MRRIVCTALSSAMILIGMTNISYAAEVGAPDNSSIHTSMSAVGPGVVPTVGVNDFLHLEVSNPIVKAVEKYSYEQMEADIQSLKSTYGDKLLVQVIGTSKDGRNIYDIIVGNPEASQQILIQGGIHAREYMTPLVMMNQVEFALANYDTGHYNQRSVSGMFQKVAIHFIPMSNPDGVTLSQFGVEAIRSEELKQVIHNCYAKDVEAGKTTDAFEVYLTKWKSNAAGVDLNYNFATGWNELTSRPAPSSMLYKGTTPLSEPESQALASIADKYPWAITISYHSQGEVIYWTSSSNGAKMASNTLAESISVMTGYRMDSSDGKGGFKDWMQSKGNPVPGVTLEVGRTPCPVPFGEYGAVWKQNKGVWIQALDYVIRRM